MAHKWIKITDPEGVPTGGKRRMSYGTKIEYPYFPSIALIGAGRAVWCDPPAPTEKLEIPVPPPKELPVVKQEALTRTKDIRTALSDDNYNNMRKVLAQYSEESTRGLNRAGIRKALKALLE